ncbi:MULTISPECIES: DUF4062 domain-containing protein [Paenibacillus]|uniref:DUF4062 domain-containing protein n=1 Tax=Paenibacillus TaxID=44249 RepID=UPI0018C2001B|nr:MULTISPECIES: DUF4062 domain-containing protein [Paenibacillus]
MAKTKIFISSVNEDGLKPLRRAVFRELTGLGHEPIMWEENLGPWPANVDPVVKCLEAVEESDIYLLFIGSKAGTYYAHAARTVTHIEFIKAHEQGKTILVFGDVEVKNAFFGTVKQLVEEFVERFIAETEQFPSPKDIMDALQQNDRVPKNIEPYVWYLLYDISLRKVYIDDLSLGVQIDWKTYFSDLLRRGSILLPLEDSIEQNSDRLEQFDEAYEVVTNLVPHLQISGFHNPEAFLKSIMSRLSGGIIEQSYGQYMSEKVGEYGDCSAATLYVLNGDQMDIVAKVGDAFGEAHYKLSNQASYVVLTYNMGEHAEQVYFKESKQMFYYSVRSGHYVLTLHFPSDPDWDNKKFILFKGCANHAIISKNPLLIEFIKLFLGGMQP